jgi:hypothetical protein
MRSEAPAERSPMWLSFFGAAAYDGRLFWASSIVFIVGLFLQR